MIVAECMRKGTSYQPEMAQWWPIVRRLPSHAERDWPWGSNSWSVAGCGCLV